jgi:hypothetical protein
MRLKLYFPRPDKSPYLAAGIEDYLTAHQGLPAGRGSDGQGGKVEETRVSEVIAEATKRLLAAVKPDEVFVHLDPGAGTHFPGAGGLAQGKDGKWGPRPWLLAWAARWV